VEGRPEFWYRRFHPVALALAGRGDEAIEMLDRCLAIGYCLDDWQYFFEVEPAFEPLRKDPRFEALHRKARSHAEAELRELTRMRREGLVPERPGMQPPPDESPRRLPDGS
jgi:hypothetical protein